MQGSEIETLIHTYNIPNFRGICTVASIPQLEQDEFVIFNLSPNPPGSHWAYLTLRTIDENKKRHYELIDSLGVQRENIVRYFPQDCYVIYNSSQLQPDDSKKCGLYCVYYAVLKWENENLDFYDLTRLAFTNNVKINDATVTDFFLRGNE